jgi:DNA-directed RNA polymerase specialized sigma24 family protein
MDPLSPEVTGAQVDFAAISTQASVVKDSCQLYRCYSDAIRQYANLLLRNPEDAEDILLTVAQRMVDGRFSLALEAVPKGRFRFFIKRSVHNAALDLLRDRQRSRDQSVLGKLWNAIVRPRIRQAGAEPAALPAEADLEEAELRIWRETVLSRAIEGALKELEEYERAHQDRAHPNIYHTLARLLLDHSGDNSEQLAQRLGERFGAEYNAGQVRSIVLRMRKKLAELLVAEIIPLLEHPTLDNVLAELGDLGLLAYVKPYLPPTGPPGTA